jgi:hypothetical protein
MITLLIIISGLALLALLFRRKPKLKDEWSWSLHCECGRLRYEVKECKNDNDLMHVEDKIDDLRNEYRGKVNEIFLDTLTNKLYSLVSNKAIELR